MTLALLITAATLWPHKYSQRFDAPDQQAPHERMNKIDGITGSSVPENSSTPIRELSEGYKAFQPMCGIF